ncbi:iron chaperone [Mucilaginibacter litoreus]|uniref:Iron chaperone n=1 Tax=Mucilaginibacter litoreus TaxID=1048221 RepID=A0ABW3AXZ0_9SPHI
MMQKPNNADEYIASFDKDVQQLLKQMRQTIKAAAPDATEVISYGMPGYKQHGVLVYFAAQSKHIGFYPGANAIAIFKNELENYKTSKGAIQFPLNKPLPLELVTRITQFRIQEDQELFEARKAKKKER